MSNKIFYSSPRARFFDSNGNPLSFGRVSFYEAGTTTLKGIYTDITTTTPAQNPALLDADGYVRDQGIWLGEGRYKFKLDAPNVIPPDINENADFNKLWTMDNIAGSTALNSGELSTIAVSTIEDLRALEVGAYSLVYVAGYWAVNDGGGGWFNYDANDVQDDNGGTVVAPNGTPVTGRYLRNLENWETSVQYFGATSTATSVVDSYVQNALTWCLANNQTLVFPSDTYTFGSTVTYQGELTISIKENAVFRSDLAIQLHFEPKNLEVNGVTNHLGDNVELYFAPIVPNTFRPEHWGALGNGTTGSEDFKGFINADGRYSDSTLIISGDYTINAQVGNPTTSFSTQKMHIEKGSTIATDLEFNIGSYTFADGLRDCFTFSKDRVKSLVDSVLYLDHFVNNVALSDADFIVLANAVTQLGTRHGSFKILTTPYFSVTGITAIPTYSMDLFIAQGTRIVADTFSELPRLSNNIGDFNILDNTGANIKFSNDVHSIVWWGASSNSSSATNILGITRAIQSASLDASYQGVVHGNNEGIVLTSANLIIDGANVKLKEFNLSNTSGFNFGFTNSSVDLYRCDITGLSLTSGGTYRAESCLFSGATDVNIVGNIVEISRCNITLSSTETLTLTASEELYYEGNRSLSGRFNFTTGSSTNVISSNRFNGLSLGDGAISESFVILNGGSFTDILNNNFKGVETASGTATGTFIEFVGNGEAVAGLNCENNYNYSDAVGSTQKWEAYKVSGYADFGHDAKVVGSLIKLQAGVFQTVLGTSVQGTYDSASGGTAVFNIYTDMIFPYRIGAFSSGSAPLFYISGIASGFTIATTGIDPLQVEAKEVTGSGGNCTIHYETRLPATTGYAITQEALIFTSVEKQRMIELGRYTI
jgi:hypothetical protein